MSEVKRPLFAPTSNFEHFWYAVLALMGPRVLIHFYQHDGFDFSWAILCLWTCVGILYTLDWAIASYRKFRKPSHSASHPAILKQVKGDCL